MITGFNTDIKHNEKVYHVQTEDKGVANPYIESLVYVGGEILASKKTSYAEQAQDRRRREVDRRADGAAAPHDDRGDQARHASISPRMRPKDAGPPRRQTDDLGEAFDAGVRESRPTVSEEKTLDQVIIDYLASEAESEHLELSLLNQVDFFAGSPIEMRVAARKSLSQQPITAAPIEVKVISTIEPPRVIFRGKTAADGTRRSAARSRRSATAPPR